MSRVPQSPIAVAHVVTATRLDAGARQVIDLAAAQAEAGHQVHLINLSGARLRHALPENVAHHALQLPWFRVAQLNMLVRRQPVQICHAHDAVASQIIARCNAPVRIGTLNTGDEHHRHQGLDGLICRSSAQVPPRRAYPGISQVVHDWIPASLGSHLHTFIAGRSLVRQRSLLRALGLPPGRVVVGALATRQDSVGLDLLVRAFRRFGPGHAVLVLIGDKRCKRRLGQLIGGLPGIHFFEAAEGWEASLPDLDLLVLASEERGPATAVLRAMQLGLPIVAVDTPGVRQLLANSPATLVPKEDADALGIAMQACIRGLRFPWSWSAHTYVCYDMSRHDRSIAVARIERFYRRLLTREAAARAVRTPGRSASSPQRQQL